MKDITKKLGFTLIELLAVIVILAIIALIVTPIVMNIIVDSKKNTAERSAENYIKQIETEVTNSYSEPENKIGTGVYYVMPDGNLCTAELSYGECPAESRIIEVDMSGAKPTSGIAVIEDGKVVSELSTDNTKKTQIIIGGYRTEYVAVGKSSVMQSTDANIAERSADNCIKTVLDREDENQIIDGTYTIEVDKKGKPTGYIISQFASTIGSVITILNNETESNKYYLDIEGSLPTAGTLYIKSGKVLDGSYLVINDFVVNFINSIGITSTYKMNSIDNHPNGTNYTEKLINYIQTQTIDNIIKYDPVSGSRCNEIDVGTCYGWYVLEDKGENNATISLILNKNLGNNVAWISKDDYVAAGGDGQEFDSNDYGNEKGPITAIKYLNNLTSDWKDIVLMPTYSQIYNVNKSITLTSSPWLYSDLKVTANANDMVYGYWTSTPHGAFIGNAWRVNYNDKMINTAIDSDVYSGVRPTLTLLKSKLN